MVRRGSFNRGSTIGTPLFAHHTSFSSPIGLAILRVSGSGGGPNFITMSPADRVAHQNAGVAEDVPWAWKVQLQPNTILQSPPRLLYGALPVEWPEESMEKHTVEVMAAYWGVAPCQAVEVRLSKDSPETSKKTPSPRRPCIHRCVQQNDARGSCVNHCLNRLCVS